MISKSVIGLACAATVFTMAGASAGPMPTNIAAVKDAATVQPTEVRWHGGWGVGAGIGLGLLGAALLTAPAYGYGYYGPSYYYGPAYYPAYYGYPYAYGPGYYAGPRYAYAYRWHHRHWRRHW